MRNDPLHELIGELALRFEEVLRDWIFRRAAAGEHVAAALARIGRDRDLIKAAWDVQDPSER